MLVVVVELVLFGDVIGGLILYLVISWFKVDVLLLGVECVYIEVEYVYNLWGCIMVVKIRFFC